MSKFALFGGRAARPGCTLPSLPTSSMGDIGMKPGESRAGTSLRAALLGATAAIAIAMVLPAGAVAGDDPKVVVSIKPLHSLVAMVMGDVAKPELLIEGAQSPHSFAMKPSQAAAVNGADVVFYSAPDVAPAIARILDTIPETVKVEALIDAPGLVIHQMRTGEAFEAHDHSHEGHDHGHSKVKHSHDGHDHGHSEAKHSHEGHDHGHSEAKHSHEGHDHGHSEAKHSHEGHDHGHSKAKHSHEGHDHGHSKVKHSHAEGGRDGHFWLDPANARQSLDRIASVLSEAFPDHADAFKANAEAASARLSDVENRIAGEVTGLSDRPFFVFHDAYQYFEKRFGLQAAGALTLNPEVPPGPRRLSEIRGKIKKADAACVFAEPQFQARVIDTVIEGTDAKKGVLDPLGWDIAPGQDHYPKMLEAMAKAFRTCLAQ